MKTFVLPQSKPPIMEFTRYGPRLLCSIALTVLSLQTNYAQNSEENQYGSWLVLCGTTRVHKDWSIPAVGIVRHHHMLDKYGFFFFRTGATYRVSQSSSVTAGFALLNSNSYLELNDIQNTNQFWIYGEYMLKSNFNDYLITHRLRLENRRLINTQDPKVTNRIRYRLQFIRPVYKRVYFKAFDEVFFDLGGNAFNQNRIFVGIGQQITPGVQADIGYFNRRFSNSNEDMIRLSLSFTLDFTRKDLALNSEQKYK